MTRGRIVTATMEHADAMASRLRIFDRRGRYEALANDPRAELRRSVTDSTHAWTGLVDDVPICLFGLHAPSLVSSYAIAWLDTTEDVERYRVAFWRGSKHVVRVMRTMYPRIEGLCDARFEVSARWLNRLGFALEEPKLIAGTPFRRFVMEGS